MPRISIAVADGFNHPDLDLVATANRIVVLDDTVRTRWSSARVVRPPKGGVTVDREGGVAVLAARGASDAEVRRALAEIPDPVVLVVLDKAPGKTLARDLDKRKATRLVPAGGLYRVECVNEPGCVSADLVTLSPPPRVAKPSTKPEPAPEPKPEPEAE